MATEHSAGFVIFRLGRGVRRYLLLYKKAGGIYKESWGFPKGWPDKNETDLKAARRETAEEAGITKIKQIRGFKETSKYYFKNSAGKLISKTVTWFLGQTRQKDVKISWEHAGFEWLLYEEAIERVTYKSERTILETAEKYLRIFLRPAERSSAREAEKYLKKKS